MKIDELPEEERRAARVYIRNRRKAWDHFFSLQDLKVGDYISTKESIYKVTEVNEAYDASPLDIVIKANCVKTGWGSIFGFSIKAAEVGLMYALLRLHNKDKPKSDTFVIKDSYELGLKLDEKAKLIYEKT